MAQRGDTMQHVDTEPATMPIALPVATRSTFSSRAKDRGRRQRELAGQEFRESMRLEWNLVKQQVTTPEDPEQARLSRQENVHFLLTLCTFGLWGPVWMYVFLRNARRHGRTPQGRATTQHIRSERERVAGEQRARRREHDRAIRAEGIEEWRRIGRALRIVR